MGIGPVNKTNTVTAEDVMPLLQEAVDETLGKRRRVIRADESIYEFFDSHQSDIFEDLGLLEFTCIIERLTGIKLSNQDWEFLTGWNSSISEDEWKIRYAPMFTFGRLAEFIAIRKRAPAIREVSILGVQSKTAGAFRAIEEIATKIKPEIKPFSPTTPILDRFRQVGLEKLWAEVRVLSSDRVPPLTGGRISRGVSRIEDRYLAKTLFLVFAVLGLSVVAYGLSSGVTLGSEFVMLLLGAALAGFLGVAIVGIIFLVGLLGAKALERDTSSASNLFPNGIVTFGDLAQLVSGERGGWCPSCQYDLTGLKETRCPECGYDLVFRPKGKKKELEE